MNKSIQNALRLLRPKDIRGERFSCPLCRGRILIRLSNSEHGVRCASCRGAPAHLSLAGALRKYVQERHTKVVYELSSRGPIHRLYRNEFQHTVVSEYLEGVAPGDFANGVQCQDVQALSFSNERFDICTSLDVFEHVANDARGFSEVYRVLKPSGLTLFTVPLFDQPATVERARIEGGKIVHLLEPEYHDDHLSGLGKVLCFRNYGHDIVERLKTAGFSSARLDFSFTRSYMGYGRPIVIARK